MKRIFVGLLLISLLIFASCHKPDVLEPGNFDNEVEVALVNSWGTSGSGNNQYSNPNDIAIDGQGNLYIVDMGNTRIQKISSDGTYITQWDDSGTKAAMSPNPTGICVNGNRVYVTDSGSGFDNVQIFDLAGGHIRDFGSYGSTDGFFNNPEDVAVDSNGNIYVCDHGNTRIQKFDKDGNFLKKWNMTNGPVSISIDSKDNVYVVTNADRMVHKFSVNGKSLGSWGGYGMTESGKFADPYRIYCDDNDYLYVVDYTRGDIQKFNSGGVHLGTFNSDDIAELGLSDLGGVAVIGSSIYVVQCAAPFVLKLQQEIK